jgi:hypothetical protein
MSSSFFVLVDLYVTGSRVHWEYCAVSFSVEKNLLTVEENDKFLFFMPHQYLSMLELSDSFVGLTLEG